MTKQTPSTDLGSGNLLSDFACSLAIPRENHLAGRFCFLLIVAGLMTALFFTRAQPLDQSWRVRVSGQTVRVNPDGTFSIPNVGITPQPTVAQSNPDNPSAPYYARLIGFKVNGAQLRYVYSDPLEITPGNTIQLTSNQLTFSDTLPIVVTSLSLTSNSTQLTSIGATTQLQLMAAMADGTQNDVTGSQHQTVYQSSDPAIASVSSEGLVTGNSAGPVYISSIHEGMVASIAIQVAPPPTARTIIGFVYSPSGQPIPNAIVHIPGTTMTATTEANGRYQISNLPAAIPNPTIRAVAGATELLFGNTSSLETSLAIVDGGILVARTMDQINALPCTDPDQDCLPDDVEIALGLNPNSRDSNNNSVPDGLEDSDGDLLTNQFELSISSLPGNPDTDGDGLNDGTEVLQFRSIPTLGDSDGNGTTDGAQDQDGDGILDIAEDLNGNYLVDAGETNPQRADSDGDAVLDSQELIDGTSPTNAYAFEPRALSHFAFNSAAFPGEQGQLPLVNSGSSFVSSFTPFGGSGFAARNGTRLIYRVVESDNHININLLRGTIKFWFKPNWNSGELGHHFGSRLLEIGRFSSTGQGNNGWWGIFFNQDRTKLAFASQGPNSLIWERYIEATNLNFQAGQWYEVELTYGPRTTYPYGRKDPLREQRYSNSYLYINGQREGHGLGVNPNRLPNEMAIAGGFALGSQIDGTLSADVTIDELKTYNYPLHTWTDRILTDRNWSARANPSDNSISLERNFPASPIFPLPVEIFRRPSGSTDWGQPLVSNYQAPTFTDRDLTPGFAYEYRIWDTSALNFGANPIVLQQHLTAAINLPPVHNRGKVIMMIENSIATPLATEIATLKTNFVGDGWKVKSHLVSRQNDDNPELNSSSIEIIKSLIDREIQPNRTNVILILGHVPVPMSGTSAADGHDNQPQNRPDHRGAWTADGFYGSTNRNFWTDVGPTSIVNLDNPQNSNIPGDGKFDQNFLPQPYGSAVGRIDFARMPAFTNAPFLPGYPNHTARSVEIELLRQYLNKNHRYRHGELTFKERFSGFRGFSQNQDTASALYNAENLAASIYGFSEDRFINMRVFPQRVSYMFGFNEMNSFDTGILLGWEHPNASQIYSHVTVDLTVLENEAKVGFHLAYGSYFGDWNLKADNWLKALLAMPNSGLATLLYFPNKWRLEKLGLGAPLAVGMQEFNDITKYSNYSVFSDGTILPFYYPNLAPPRMLSILGDPTLRVHILRPPKNPRVTTQGGQISLSWDPHPESGVTYHVHRSTNGLDGPFTHITAIAPPTSPNLVDPSAPSGPKLYRIRAAKTQLSGSGSYINLSQGTFIAVE
ncbi:MAG: hypothetical protein M2R45_04639 [Verrucomicrobia subdivision 3 bacterium]|nr:hypothetical protein [Limisphaerales bacterium]MCS1417131.1 hypothetical protein [Limisphaerales bacterium]